MVQKTPTAKFFSEYFLTTSYYSFLSTYKYLPNYVYELKFHVMMITKEMQ